MGRRRGNRLREGSLTNPEILKYSIEIVRNNEGFRFSSDDVCNILKDKGYDITPKRVCLLIPRIASDYNNIHRAYNEVLSRWEYFVPRKGELLLVS